MPHTAAFYQKAVDHLLRGIEQPATEVFLAFVTAPVEPDGSNLDEVELAGADRVPANYGPLVDGYGQGEGDVTWTGLPAATVVGIVAMDAEVGGTMLLEGDFSATFTEGQSLTIAAADINQAFA